MMIRDSGLLFWMTLHSCIMKNYKLIRVGLLV